MLVNELLKNKSKAKNNSTLKKLRNYASIRKNFTKYRFITYLDYNAKGRSLTGMIFFLIQ